MTANQPPQTYSIPANTNSNAAYPSHQSPSPDSSVSPTSSRIHNWFHQPQNQPKQLREHRRPLYVPAALRPTEFASGPMTPPKSLHGSLDSLDSRGEVEQAAGQSTFDPSILGLTGPWVDDEDLGEVTGPPERSHWKPDDASPTCDSARCRLSFNLITRRHHCRHCGHVFCSQHSSFTAPLNQDAKFHPDGIMSRVCDTCYRQYQRWEGARSIRAQRRESDDEVATPVDGAGSPGRNINSRLQVGASDQQQLGNSVPKDWAWSTF